MTFSTIMAIGCVFIFSRWSETGQTGAHNQRNPRMSHNFLPAWRVVLMHRLARTSIEAKNMIVSGRIACGRKPVLSPHDPVRRDADLVVRGVGAEK